MNHNGCDLRTKDGLAVSRKQDVRLMLNRKSFRIFSVGWPMGSFLKAIRSFAKVFAKTLISRNMFSSYLRSVMKQKMGDKQIENLKNQIKFLKERLGKKNEELEAAKRHIKDLKSETENLKQVKNSGDSIGDLLAIDELRTTVYR